MASLKKSRLRRVEERLKDLPEPPCPECDNTIKMITVCQGGWYLYEGCKPCPICNAWPRERHRESADNLEEEASDREPLGLAEYLRDVPRKPITRIYVTCIEPPEVPDLEDLDENDVLQAPDGTLYRREE